MATRSVSYHIARRCDFTILVAFGTWQANPRLAEVDAHSRGQVRHGRGPGAARGRRHLANPSPRSEDQQAVLHGRLRSNPSAVRADHGGRPPIASAETTAPTLVIRRAADVPIPVAEIVRVRSEISRLRLHRWEFGRPPERGQCHVPSRMLAKLCRLFGFSRFGGICGRYIPGFGLLEVRAGTKGCEHVANLPCDWVGVVLQRLLSFVVPAVEL